MRDQNAGGTRRVRGRPFSKGNPGKPIGATNKVKREMSEFLRDLANDPEVRSAIRAKVLTDPVMQKELLARTQGKVPDILQLETPAPLVVDLVAGPEE